MQAKSFTLAIALAAATPATAPAAAPEFPEPGTRLLVPAGPGADGRWRVGLEIALPEGWHTYWRNPGEAGVPPVFDTSGSANLADFTVAWPAPERWTDGFSVSNVYHGVVVLPVTVTPADPAAPVDLAVGLDYGYCREVCIPIRADFTATLDPSAQGDPAADAAVEAAFARVPVAEADAPAGAPRLSSIERIGDDRKTAVLRIAVDSADPAAADLFVEPPEGWYLGAPVKTGTEESVAIFEQPLRGMPKDAAFAGAPFRFTMTDGKSAVEAIRTLD